MEHKFWLFLSIGCILWYLAVTGYIAFRGLLDIKSMLKEIQSPKDYSDQEQANKAITVMAWKLTIDLWKMLCNNKPYALSNWVNVSVIVMLTRISGYISFQFSE